MLSVHERKRPPRFRVFRVRGGILVSSENQKPVQSLQIRILTG